MTWDEAVVYALTLPGTALSTHYRQPAVKVAANGCAFLNAGHEPGDSFCVQIDRDTVDLLLATDPATFHQTPHYAGHATVLVRYAAADADRVRAVIAQAHAEAAARPRARR
jgi:hypothetical protein